MRGGEDSRERFYGISMYTANTPIHNAAAANSAVAFSSQLGVGHFTKIVSRTPALEYWQRDFEREKTGVQNTCGKSACVVDCMPEEVLAWHFDYCSNERCRASIEKNETIRLSFRR